MIEGIEDDMMTMVSCNGLKADYTKERIFLHESKIDGIVSANMAFLISYVGAVH